VPLDVDFESDESLDFKKDTEIILDFFQSQISIIANNNQDVVDIFNDYRIELLEKFYENGEFDLLIDFTAQREMYQKLSMFFFINTWGFGTSKFANDPVYYLSINLKLESEVLGMIRQNESSNEFITNYMSTLKAAGDISPANVGNMLSILTNEDLKRPEVRLLMALHYLTLNDQAKRRVPL
jgi:hypothetical protein